MAQHISNHRFVSALRDIIKNDRYDSIREAVAKEALAHTSPVQFLENVVQQGCSIAGEVFCFNSINDTLAFYDKHHYEIEALREDYEEDCGVTDSIDDDYKNDYVLMAFQEVAYQLAFELGLEV